MPHFNIIRQTKPKKSYRIASLMGMFDLKEEKIVEHFEGEIPIENMKWNVGVIVGASGTGKSTIGKELFNTNYIQRFIYKEDNILDDMPKNVELSDIFKVFNSVGFSSPPSWAKPYSVLSTGEKMRVDLARAIIENKDLIVFDEFTSVVDRTVAKIGSFAIQKSIRKANKKFIAISCHYDILEWLEPDWVFNTDTMSFYLGAELPNIKDLQSILKSTNVKEQNGESLGNIII